MEPSLNRSPYLNERDNRLIQNEVFINVTFTHMATSEAKDKNSLVDSLKSNRPKVREQPFVHHGTNENN